MRIILVPPSQGLGEDKRNTSKCLEPCWAQTCSVNPSHYYYVITINLFLYCTGYLVDYFNLETQTFTVGTSACIISFIISFHFLHTFSLESLLSIKFLQCYISIHLQWYSIFLSYFLNVCMYMCVYIYTHTYVYLCIYSMHGCIIYVFVCVHHSVTSNSSQPHGWWPARLLCPWDLSGKNTGVGSHSLVQRIFPTRRSKRGLLDCRQILDHLSHQGSPALMYTIYVLYMYA